MIEKLNIEGIHMSVEDNVRRYVIRKIGHLDKYLPKHAKESAHAEVMLKKSKRKSSPFSCEVNLHLPKEIIHIEESTINIIAAIDIVEAKLKNRIEKYKELHGSVKLHRHLMDKFRKRAAQNL